MGKKSLGFADIQSPSGSITVQSMSLYQLLADKKGCYEFIAHLLKEFSAENVLSVIEMTQYKQFFIKWYEYNSEPKLNDDNDHITDFDDDDDDEYNFDDQKQKDIAKNKFLRINNVENSKSNLSLQDMWNGHDLDLNQITPLKSESTSDEELDGTEIIDLPRNLPQSTIVWKKPIESVSGDEIRDKIRLLFEKYVTLGSELELNISFRTRKEMNRRWSQLNNMDVIKLYSFFDVVIESMIKLMQDSYTRFRMTKGFVEYERAYFERKNVEKESIKERIFNRKLSPNLSLNINFPPT